MTRKPRVCDSAILHVCDPDSGADGCMCWLNPACTGEWRGQKMVVLPRWLSMLLAPRKVAAMFRARRTLRARLP